ncbi:rhodanese-like domain-containing protein [Streptomyces albidoflavus]|uniref:rhodanese-like domain-containing protein n=1 Tax=Streptomyces TaxID=1883 RepID=UPI0008F527FE|nr:MULTISPECIES: rhodanese-like domain-containing protein [Streptomyces]UNR60149.1 rhodanese-like domain-containing protein [Streptomyces sp. A10(2020)]
MNQQLSAAPQPTSSAPAATGDSLSAVLAVPPAPPAEAAALLRAALARHTDVSDVAADLATGTPGFTLVDSRSTAAWDQGHVPGAVHLPAASVPALAGRLLDPARPVVTYCWGPGCDGATRAALALAEQGFRVKEMLGGFEYWVREGFPYDTADGPRTSVPDPLTAPLRAADDCGC